jgi:RimK family alpha-L-glutamate ligase
MSKKKGMLITNSFLNTNKFSMHYQWLRDAAQEKNIQLDVYGNAEIIVNIDQADTPHWISDYDFILFWDKDIRLGRYLSFFCQRKHIPIFNTPQSIAACDDKYETYLQLMEWNQSHPQKRIHLIPTILAPMTYQGIGYSSMGSFLHSVEERLGFPLIVKECFGSFGMQVYRVESMSQLQAITEKLAGVPFIYQKEMKEKAGCDVRLQVVDGKVVAGMERKARNDDFRANISHGGSMSAYAWSEKEAQAAVQAALALHLDFAGVDLLFEGNQATLVCEVNSNAHFYNLFQCTGVNVAEKIMSMIQKKLESGS